MNEASPWRFTLKFRAVLFPLIIPDLPAGDLKILTLFCQIMRGFSPVKIQAFVFCA
jgi:hypothetical protein